MICGAKAMPTMEPINSTQNAKLTVNQKALRTRPELRAVVKAADRLEALAQADDGRVGELQVRA